MTPDRFVDASLDRVVDLTLRALSEVPAEASAGASATVSTEGQRPGETNAPSQEPLSGEIGYLTDGLPGTPVGNPAGSSPAEPSPDRGVGSMDQLLDSVSHALRGMDAGKPATGRPPASEGGVPRNPMLQPPADHAVDIRR